MASVQEFSSVSLVKGSEGEENDVVNHVGIAEGEWESNDQLELDKRRRRKGRREEREGGSKLTSCSRGRSTEAQRHCFGCS